MFDWLKKICMIHDWEDLGLFQYVVLFTRSGDYWVYGDYRVYRCTKCGAQREYAENR